VPQEMRFSDIIAEKIGNEEENRSNIISG